MFEDAVDIRDRLADFVDRLDPDAVSGSAARDLWGVLDASERLCAAGKTLLARRIAATHRPEKAGAKTAAEELARRSGTSTGAARDALDTSARLPVQPGVDGALRRGELSLAQAAVVSAAVAANPAEEHRLVELASQVSVPELREECARVRAAADPDPAATNRRLHAQRRLRRWTDSEGFWNLHAKGTPQAGAAFNAVLDAVTDQVFNAARRAGRSEPVEAYGFDALMALADQAVDSAADQPNRISSGLGAPETSGEVGQDSARPVPRGDAEETRGESGSSQTAHGPSTSPGPGEANANIGELDRLDSRPDADLPAARLPERLNPRYLALLRVDVAALRRGRVTGDELCEIRGVGPVPVPVAERLLGQAVLHLVITRGTDVLNVTHLGRGPTAAQRIALAWASPGCTVLGCWRTRTENDHREPWAQTRHTRLDQLDPLCDHHHDLKTRFGWALVDGTGKRRMVPPDDPRHPRHRANPRTGRARPEDSPTGIAAAGITAAQPNPNPPTHPSMDRPAQQILNRPGERTSGQPGRRSSGRPAPPTLPDPPGDPPQAA
ncbi:MAG TPA: DUF222 domain-containing protein [Jiangellaceae bacterium]|nr:DUF222 domain-containing protein [Jiangellaceae bacterium]